LPNLFVMLFFVRSNLCRGCSKKNSWMHECARAVKRKYCQSLTGLCLHSLARTLKSCFSIDRFSFAHALWYYFI
jgi:hypothetical protein